MLEVVIHATRVSLTLILVHLLAIWLQSDKWVFVVDLFLRALWMFHKSDHVVGVLLGLAGLVCGLLCLSCGSGLVL